MPKSCRNDYLLWYTNTHIQPAEIDCKSTFCGIQKNPIKPNKTGRYAWRGPLFPLRYAQHTKIHSNAFGSRTWFSRFPERAGKKKAELGVAGEGKGYGRLARSDEHSSSFAVSGSESGHALQVRERAADSGVQIGQSVALQKIEAGRVDGREVDGNRSAR